MSWISPEEYFKQLPRKWCATHVLLFNPEGKFLIVKPTYKDNWHMPGGNIDKNESPTHGAVREVKEELNIDISNPQLVCVEYVFDNDQVKGDRFHFVFNGGNLTESQINLITLPADELSDYKFVFLEEALSLLGTTFEKRIPGALQAKKESKLIYLENIK